MARLDDKSVPVDGRNRESSKCYRETNGRMEDQTGGN